VVGDVLRVSERNEVVDSVQESEGSPMVWSSASIASSHGEELWPERLRAGVAFTR
jgi:hypothetical protein